MNLGCVGEEYLVKSRVKLYRRCAAWALCLAAAHCAASQAPGSPPQTSPPHIVTKAAPSSLKKTAAAGTPGPERLPSKTPPMPSPPEAGATHSTVTLKNETLTIEANNSDLNRILKKIADLSGMTVNGFISSPPVFGIYGPGNPREILTDLLTGSGYNFIMVGITHQGAPRELLLTLQNGGSTPANASTQTVTAFNRRDNPEANSSDEEPPGPGAIIDAPPEPPQDPQERTQQNLQRLQQMHDRQTQQNLPQ